MSIRRSRFEWIASIFKPKRVKRSKKPAATKIYAKPKRWQYAAPVVGVSGLVLGFTRSHARAEIKKAHGLKTTAGIGLMLNMATR